jgi:2-(1,2-epoxy-1,2-dihydrophenyl)acetyl-CoA isomerase
LQALIGRRRATADQQSPDLQHAGEATMPYEHILVSHDGGVATITLNRPQVMNALHTGVIGEMIDAVDAIRDGITPARCLVLTGAGRGFSSGADLSGGGAGGGSIGKGPIDAGKVLETHFNVLLERLFALPLPFITAVNGPAAGAGCSFALAGDIVLASQTAYFLQAFVNIGLVPDVGSTWLLPRLAGKARAQAMMMLGERISAETALDWGMIWKVSQPDALQADTMAIAHKLANGPTRALALIRHGIRDCLDKTLTEALMVERRNQLQAGRSSDFAEGVMAFLQKRPAAFTGA